MTEDYIHGLIRQANSLEDEFTNSEGLHAQKVRYERDSKLLELASILGTLPAFLIVGETYYFLEENKFYNIRVVQFRDGEGVKIHERMQE